MIRCIHNCTPPPATWHQTSHNLSTSNSATLSNSSTIITHNSNPQYHHLLNQSATSIYSNPSPPQSKNQHSNSITCPIVTERVSLNRPESNSNLRTWVALSLRKCHRLLSIITPPNNS